jgi:serine/threonine protein kinase
LDVGAVGGVPTAGLLPVVEGPGTNIGPYKLLQKLGEGGMGVVYMAEQKEPIRRRVALKIIKPGMDSQQVLARFEAERQALAAMDHPNIAKVLGAGMTDSARPYFTMDLVKGVPITDYCDEHCLSASERLELFIPVCRALQHAHQKGIVHRDVKPTNVLVAEFDNQAVPKIIDFGVAKAIDQQLTERTLFTQFGQVVGTPEYMSPEQAKLNQLDVDTRSDIYSLGVLLYELLTGATPFDKQRLRSAAFEELLRIIREEDPPRPSVRLSTVDELPIVATKRKSEPKKLSVLLRGELDWLVMKAMDKERSRRYDSASALADDVQRYLSGAPVVACPPSRGYLLRKSLHRHKVAIGTATAVFLALSLGIVATSWMAAEYGKERRKAIVAKQVAEQAEAEATTALRVAERALKNWRQELYLRALTAAFSGDREKVQQIIKDATAVNGSPPNWGAKITAQLQLFFGHVEEALITLKEAETGGRYSEDPGAVALLALACLQSGKHDEYIQTRTRLRDMKPKANQSDWLPEDRLLVGQVEQFGDIAEGERIIRSVLEEHPSPLALALHSQALMKMCYDTPDKERRARALEELNAAKLMMPDCAFLAVLEMWAYIPFEINKEISRDRRVKIEAAAKVLNKIDKYASGQHTLACWADMDDRPDDARRHWDAVVGDIDSHQGGYICDYYAAFEYRRGNRDKAERLLRGACSDSVLAAIHLGEMLAFESGREEDARGMYVKATEAIDKLTLGPDDFIGIPETILVLLDGPGKAAGELNRRREFTSLPLQRQMLKFLADYEMHPEDLLSSIDRESRNSRSMAHKLIEMRHLSCGETQLAAEQLQACLNVTYWLPDSVWAHAFLSQRNDDETRRKPSYKQ